MSFSSLKDRMSEYKDTFDYKLQSKLPVIICLNGRSFLKTTSLLDKPFCEKFSEAMKYVVTSLVNEVEGVVFAYSFNDEIILICKNDQTLDTKPWYSNKIQSIASSTASIATLNFTNYANSIDLNIMSGGIFLSQVYTLPSLTECVNLLIYKQQIANQISLYYSLYYEYLKTFHKDMIERALFGWSDEQKIEVLQDKFGIDYFSYPSVFRNGFACYRSPKVINDVVKNKWAINNDLPSFIEDNQFILNILKNGVDIVRAKDLAD